MGGQGLCSVSADGNKTLIITSQTAKHYQIRTIIYHLKFGLYTTLHLPSVYETGMTHLIVVTVGTQYSNNNKKPLLNNTDYSLWLYISSISIPLLLQWLLFLYQTFSSHFYCFTYFMSLTR